MSANEPDFFDLARAEMIRAQECHGARYASLHEGYAVLLEEMDELWEIVRQKAGARDPHHLLAELLQIAAVAGKAALSAGALAALEMPSAGGAGDLVHHLQSQVELKKALGAFL